MIIKKRNVNITDYQSERKMNLLCKDGLDKLGKLLLFFCILMEKNEFLARMDYLQWPVLLMLVSVLFVQLCFKNKILNDFVFLWLIAFIFCISCSTVWAFNSTKVLEDIKYLVKITVVLGYGLYIIKKEHSLEFLISSMIFSTTVSVAMILPNIAIRSGSQIVSRAEIIIKGIEINVNQVCPDIAFATLFLMYRMRTCQKKLPKILYSGMIAVFTLTILFLGARASLLVVLGGMMLNALTGFGKSVLRNITLAMLLMIIMLILVLNVPALYDAIGNRIVDTVNLVLGNKYVSENQRSDSLRMQLIKNGWDMFLKKPLFGYGSGNYASINLTYYGSKYYSHNNYIELLAGLGITGTLVYYLFHFRLLLQVFKRKVSCKNNHVNLAKHIILCMLMLDITYVTYNVMDMWLCLLIAYGGAYLGMQLNKEGVISENSICS